MLLSIKSAMNNSPPRRDANSPSCRVAKRKDGQLAAMPAGTMARARRSSGRTFFICILEGMKQWWDPAHPGKLGKTLLARSTVDSMLTRRRTLQRGEGHPAHVSPVATTALAASLLRE